VWASVLSTDLFNVFYVRKFTAGRVGMLCLPVHPDECVQQLSDSSALKGPQLVHSMLSMMMLSLVGHSALPVCSQLPVREPAFGCGSHCNFTSTATLLLSGKCYIV